MKKHYVKPELETVEVMVELGFADSQVESSHLQDAQTYFIEDGWYHQTQGNEWVTDTDSWF